MLKTVLVQNVFKPNTIVAEEYGIRPEMGGRMLQVLFPIELISQSGHRTPSASPAGPIQSAPNCDSLRKLGKSSSHPFHPPLPPILVPNSNFHHALLCSSIFQLLLFLDFARLLAFFLQSVIKSERGRAPYGLMALAGQGWWWICAARRAPYMQETFCLRPVLRPWWPRQGRTGWDLWKAVLSAHSAPMSPLVTSTVWVSDWTSGWIGSG